MGLGLCVCLLFVFVCVCVCVGGGGCGFLCVFFVRMPTCMHALETHTCTITFARVVRNRK